MRITGGVHRSRRLVAPRGSETRPTSDRVREALFSILGAQAVDARVLDLYAGTGALGIEALSRGAARATFVERGREALAALRANLKSLALDERARVVAAPVDRAVKSLTGEAFDLVLVDPPYALVPGGEVARVLALYAFAGAFAPDALLVLEHASADAPPALADVRVAGGGLSFEETRRYGDSSVSLYRSVG